MTEYSGFWSYVHRDDAADGGRITQLVHDIVAQYEMLSTDTIEVFLDRESLAWGNAWQVRIDTSLASVAFFIPVLTPRYFASPACLLELNTFARRATDLGVRQLLMPIVYMDFPGVDDAEPSDEDVALVKQFHWVDWRENRFADVSSSEYRRGVAAMAARLVEANQAAEGREAGDHAVRQAEEDESEGVIELLARFEAALPELSNTTTAITAAIVEVNDASELAGQAVQNPANQTFARRLNAVRQYAQALAAPASSIRSLGDDFATQLHDVDLGVRTVIERAAQEPESRENFCVFFSQIRELVDSAETGLGALQGMVDAATPLEALSRDLRAPIRDIKSGLTKLVEGREVMRPWLTLIDSSGIECGDSQATGAE